MATKIKKTKILPPIYVFSSMIAMYVVHRYVPIFTIQETRLPGIVVIIIGVGGVLYCAYLFYREKTPIKPFEESSVLIYSWPYTMTRNPIYLSMIIFLIGFSLWLGSVSSYLVIPLFTIWIHTRFVLQEEYLLEQRFAEKYLTYKNQVRRWL